MFVKKIQGEMKTERNKKSDSSKVRIPPWVATYITYLSIYESVHFCPYSILGSQKTFWSLLWHPTKAIGIL